MIPSEPRTPGLCAKDCPRRAPGCHNASTCPAWAVHEAQKAERMAKKEERWLTWEERAACKGP